MDKTSFVFIKTAEKAPSGHILDGVMNLENFISNLTRVLGDTWYSPFRLAPSPSNQSVSTLFKKLSKRITSLDTGADVASRKGVTNLKGRPKPELETHVNSSLVLGLLHVACRS